MLHEGLLVLLGIAVGAFGTLIGAGGGFVLMPLLLFLYPDDSPELLTSISLAVVFANTLSGSAAYARLGRIDYRAGVLFAAATIPGAVLGALATAHVPRRLFDAVFGVLLLVIATLLLRRPGPPRQTPRVEARKRAGRTVSGGAGSCPTYTYDPVVGVALSLVVGFLSSVLGIGGGVLHVPMLVQVLGFPVHVATATSQFVLAVMALAGTVVHVAAGTLAGGLGRTVTLGIGVLLGAQLGAALSPRVRGEAILRGLALALALVGVRILWQAF